MAYFLQASGRSTVRSLPVAVLSYLLTLEAVRPIGLPLVS